MMYLLLYCFLYTVYFGVTISDKILFSCISTSSLSCIYSKILFLNETGENFITYLIKTK